MKGKDLKDHIIEHKLLGVDKKIKAALFKGDSAPAVASSDELVKVSANDTTAGYLNGKLVAGTGITLTENNDAANETLTIDAHVPVTVTDSTTIDFTLAGQDITGIVKTDSINDTHIDWGTGANQVSASDMPNEDVGDITITGGVWAVEDDSHAHTGATLSGIDISTDTNLAVTAPIVLTDDTLSHSSANGYVHVPASGASAQILQYSSAGTAKWVTVSSDVTIADGGAMTVADDSHNHTVTTLPDVESLTTSLTAGSVVFSDGTNLAQDNANFFWDDATNELFVPSMNMVHTATSSDDYTLELDTNAAGYGDVKALDIVYTTGAIAAGQDEGVILVNIDETLATGGDVFALEVLATDGSAEIYGMKAGALVGPIHQDSGVFANPTTGTDNTPSTDVPAMIDGSILTTTAIFEAQNEYIIIGAAAAFEEIEFILTTEASNPGIKPTFWYSTAGTAQFTQFTPTDGTNGFRNTGVVAWDASDLTGHVADDVTGTFDIKVIRTRNNLTTSPILGYAKTAATTEYIWDKDGVITVKNYVSAVATGTAPYACTSTTVNTNLNADTTDGFHLNQTVTSGAAPTFAGDNFTDIPVASILAGTFGSGAYTMDTSLEVPTIGYPGDPDLLTLAADSLTINGQVAVDGGLNTTLTLEFDDSAGGYGEVLFKDAGDSKWSAGVIRDGSATPNSYYIYQYTDAADAAVALTRFAIDDAGQVGIGETAPETALEISSTSPYITLHNTTHEDTNFGREGRLLFKGEQSGGEESTLASIWGFHRFTGDDQKGQLTFQVNAGSDGDSPTEMMRIEDTGNVGMGTNNPAFVQGGGLEIERAGAVTLRLQDTTSTDQSVELVNDQANARFLFNARNALDWRFTDSGGNIDFEIKSDGVVTHYEGSTSGNFTVSASSVTTAVTFANAYVGGTTPKVVCSPQENFNFGSIRVHTLSNTGFTCVTTSSRPTYTTSFAYIAWG